MIGLAISRQTVHVQHRSATDVEAAARCMTMSTTYAYPGGETVSLDVPDKRSGVLYLTATCQLSSQREIALGVEIHADRYVVLATTHQSFLEVANMSSLYSWMDTVVGSVRACLCRIKTLLSKHVETADLLLQEIRFSIHGMHEPKLKSSPFTGRRLRSSYRLVVQDGRDYFGARFGKSTNGGRSDPGDMQRVADIRCYRDGRLDVLDVHSVRDLRTCLDFVSALLSDLDKGRGRCADPFDMRLCASGRVYVKCADEPLTRVGRPVLAAAAVAHGLPDAQSNRDVVRNLTSLCLKIRMVLDTAGLPSVRQGEVVSKKGCTRLLHALQWRRKQRLKDPRRELAFVFKQHVQCLNLEARRSERRNLSPVCDLILDVQRARIDRMS